MTHNDITSYVLITLVTNERILHLLRPITITTILLLYMFAFLLTALLYLLPDPHGQGPPLVTTLLLLLLLLPCHFYYFLPSFGADTAVVAFFLQFVGQRRQHVNTGDYVVSAGT